VLFDNSGWDNFLAVWELGNISLRVVKHIGGWVAGVPLVSFVRDSVLCTIHLLTSSVPSPDEQHSLLLFMPDATYLHDCLIFMTFP
jgi:hypothetical protein